MNVVILQPSYLPWRGYFHLIQKADIFVFYDDVQYDEHGWRNRNQIKTAQGLQWLTIPVHSKGVHRNHIPIKDVTIEYRTPWLAKHWRTIEQNYRKAPCFEKMAPALKGFYEKRHEFLADFTIEITIAISGLLGNTHTRFVRSSTLGGEGKKTDRLIVLLKQLGATHYISGPSAKDYLEPDKFSEAGISLEFIGYQYPAYPQLYGPFEPQVSIVDLLLNTGENAASYIWKSAAT